MSGKKEILAYIEGEMPESYKKELVKGYICNITSELKKHYERDAKIKQSREAGRKRKYSSKREGIRKMSLYK